ncbi:hypothetical protein [Endozoicomonas sp. 8E]|uniref:hypothetical protein n=1 Tax=Endozoicomonas sp. 8E TaxID=3035692 RepID=UPI0029394D22|nr:hypothetical protein [Endozoicomonas sp. 8E]WOG26018.1 hypothetical protein P6910_15725 [Endozoicomonas sp. 8E]
MSDGNAGGPKAAGSQFADLMRNVTELENIHRKGKTGRVEVTGISGAEVKDSPVTFRGRKVVSVKPRQNLLKRLIAFFSPTRRAREQRAREREAKALLHDQVLLALGDKGLDKQDRRRLVNDVAKGIIPGFSNVERREIKDRSLDALYRSKSMRMILSEAEQGINTFPTLTDSIPSVSLYKARDAIKGYYTTLLLDPDRISHNSPTRQDLEKLEQHFKETRQPIAYEYLVTEVIEEIVHSFRERLPQDEYFDLLSTWSDEYKPDREQVLAGLLRQIFFNATVERPSIHGRPRDLVLEKSYRFIQDMSRHQGLKARFDLTSRVIHLETQFHKDKAQVCRKLDRLSAEVTELDLEGIKERLKAGEELSQKEGQLIAESRRVLLDIQLTAGRRWDLNLLSQPEQWSGQKDYLVKLLKIQEIGTLRGQQIDLAQLDWLIKQHDDARTHPRVAIEGAGLTGLMLALSQFEAGANVSLFEKRSSEYDKVQIVRLDRKWMDMLKFYLGEHYHELFGEGGEGNGIVHPDGIGEIATDRLEEVLHDRLAELIARNNEQTSDSEVPSSLERIVAFELERIEPGEEGYQIRARYNPAYDSAQLSKTKDYTPGRALKHRSVDMLICADGKNSRLRGRYMTDHLFSFAKPYGVCSWEFNKGKAFSKKSRTNRVGLVNFERKKGEELQLVRDELVGDWKNVVKKGKALPNQKQNTFQDFREMVVFNKDFHQHFNKLLTGELFFLRQPDESIKSAVVPEDLAELERLTLDQGMQTRCFENKDLVYIGMELPEPFDQYCKKLEDEILQKELSSLGSRLDPLTAEGAVKKAKEGVKMVQKAWFQAVAHYYGIDRSTSLGATSDKMNQKFASVFPLSQQRVKQNVVTEKAHGHNLAVTVAGEAAASSHFMTGSGLSGARENILHLQNFTHKTAKDTYPFDPAQHQADLEAKQKITADEIGRRDGILMMS